MPTIVQSIAYILPVISYIVYKAATKPPFISLFSAITGLGYPSNIPIHGFADEEYKEAYDHFVNNFKMGYDVGAAVSVYVDGKQVISLQGGWQDREKKIEYTKDTLQMVFSVTKTLSCLIVAQLVDQGLLSYDERIASYWPEFSQGNKENVTLMDLMRHTAGVGALENLLSYKDVTNPETFSDILARQPHNFNGVPTHSYHAVTQGYYINEIIRRVDPLHRTVDDFAREFREAYGSEWYLKPDATPGLDMNRIAPFYEKSIFQQILFFGKLFFQMDKDFMRNAMDRNSLYSRTMINANIDQVEGIMNRDPKYRSIEGPSYSGHTNADSIAKLAAMMANKGKAIVPGEPDLFLNEMTFSDATRYIDDEKDAIFTLPLPLVNQRGGFMVFNNKDYFNTSDDEAYFEGGAGAGGSLFLYNQKYKIGLGYVSNGFILQGADIRTFPLVKSVFEQAKRQMEAKKT